jgi:integrase
MEQDVERGQMSAQSLKTYDEIWSGKVKPAFGHVPVAEVTPVAVQDFILSIPRSSVGSCKSVLSHIMQRAMMLEYRDNDPTRIRFKLPPAGRKYSEGVWTLEQLDQAWGVLRGSVVETPFLLCAHAGLRVGEAFGLKVSDLAYDGEFMTISVERAVSKDGNVCPLKTATSRRVAVMAQPYAGRLAEIVAEQEGEWLIPDGMGFVLDRNKAEKVWRKAARSTGLPYITMSRLRNSYETYMHWEVGISQERVSKILGHAKVGTTQTYYDLPHADSVASSIIDAIRNATE